jgi:hypothetical protein
MIYLGGYDGSTCTFGWPDGTVAARVTAIRDHPASQGFTYTWDCCGDPDTLANHPELWDTRRRENGR